MQINLVQFFLRNNLINIHAEKASKKQNTHMIFTLVVNNLVKPYLSGDHLSQQGKPMTLSLSYLCLALPEAVNKLQKQTKTPFV